MTVRLFTQVRNYIRLFGGFEPTDLHAVESYFQKERMGLTALHIALYCLVLVWHLVFNASEARCNTLAKMILGIVNLALFVHDTGPLTGEYVTGIITMIKHLNIRAVLETVCICPDCGRHYSCNPDGSWPTTCTEQLNPADGVLSRAERRKAKKKKNSKKQKKAGASEKRKGGETEREDVSQKQDFHGRKGLCGASLGLFERSKGGKDIFRPHVISRTQRISSFIARLLTRRDLEKSLDEIPKKSKFRHNARDIWEASFVRSLKWKGEQPFFRLGDSPEDTESDPSEGRLMFALGIDWFNALHSGAAKKAWSIGAIYLVCLNLPPELRFKRENICLLGIIPGPYKPSHTEMNHFLHPIVDELLQLWTTGIWFTRTSLFPMGRRIRAALGPLVCDLDACRSIAGFAYHQNVRFCSCCLLRKSDITNLDPSSWPKRNLDQHRDACQKWHSAQTLREREALRDEFGVQWSALLRLPYWNPIECTVIDVMHNMFLGNILRHFRYVWGLDVELEGGDGSELVVTGAVPTPEQMVQARKSLSEGSLSKLYANQLEALCIECEVVPILNGIRTKARMIEVLEDWVSFFINDAWSVRLTSITARISSS